jgi:SAM-dependent methyltransferase
MHEGLWTALSRRAPAVRGLLLDYGCGGRPYEHLFSHCTSYIGADRAQNEMADLHYAPGAPLPLCDASVDAVLSTQVLEHVREPRQYLDECRRVLKPGGRLLLSTHGFWVWHGPGDWHRWTHEGLISEIESAGLRVVDLDAICVSKAFLLQFLNLTVFSRLLNYRLTSAAGSSLIAITNVVGRLFPGEILSSSAMQGTHLPFCYLAVAVRDGASTS